MNIPSTEAECLQLAKDLWGKLVLESCQKRLQRTQSIMRSGSISIAGVAGIRKELIEVFRDSHPDSNASRASFSDEIQLVCDMFSGKIFAATPDDCIEALSAWRAAQQEIFHSPSQPAHEQYQKEQDLFSALMTELSLSGVTQF